MLKKAISLTAALTVTAHFALAQDAADLVYIQIEARTSLAGAEESVRNYVDVAPNVNGFALGGGWYGVALGPYSRDQAEQVLRDLRVQRRIPNDSYIEQARAYGQQFWPVGAQPPVAPVATPVQPTTPAPVVVAEPEPAPAPEPAPVPAPQPVVELEPEETPREARRSESRLSREERKDLQVALKWAGFYNAAIDGAYGRGTRRSMSAWQEANGHEPTGVLTTRQRAQLLAQYNAVLDGMGLQLVADPGAGIEMQLPLGAVEFDRYEAPFALYRGTGAVEGAQVLLISQPGDRKTMNGLYEIMQTLEIVPLEGPRERSKNGFVLNGVNSRIVSHTEVELRNGEIKGFTLIWPAGDEERRTRVLGMMQKDYKRLSGVLDPAAVSDQGQGVDLVSGLAVRKAKGNASGFFVESRGTVLTSASAVDQCERVTLNGLYNARVLASDDQLGLAILTPEDTLAPSAVAEFRSDVPRLQSEIAISGYSFGGVLTAPTLTFGTLQDLRGLTGDERVARLSLEPLPGDVGAPVYDAGGAVMGVLLPQDNGGRQLPEQVSFAVKGEVALNYLRDNGIQPAAHSGESFMAPEDLTTLAGNMTVLVSCW
ncbi:MAG: serine protease [Pelagimonas sp.]|jgi:peptidoglycan hydrolase-like protein with peptidoglycan-binding domain|nr:serine protease [Pelagimonas sp.]